jgi:twinkle protein
MIIPTNIDFAEYIHFVGVQESQSIQWADAFKESVIERLTSDDQIAGTKLVWSKTHNTVRFRSGELSIWAGMNGHRKSMLLGHIMAWFAQDERICIASLEMKPAETLIRMSKQIAGCYPSPQYASKILDWMHQRVCIYDQLDTVEAERIVGMCVYASKVLGCKHIMVDSLTKCGIDSADYKAEKKFIDKLQWVAKTFDVHIHLVAHVRKPHTGGEEFIPDKFSVRGAGELTDLVDNVFICWRNKAKEALIEKQNAGRMLSPEEVSKLDFPDQLLSVCKQRHGEWEGRIGLWFDPNSLQFTGDDRKQRIPFDLV